MADVTLRKALAKDVPQIHALLTEGAERGLLLPRTMTQLYTVLRDFSVLEEAGTGTIAACGALAVIAEGLAEVRSLYVADEHRRKGFGQRLVATCIEEAAALGLGQVFSLTYQTEFFASLGFRVVPKETLPQKIWTDCIHCPKFPNCDEVAMIRSV